MQEGTVPVCDTRVLPGAGVLLAWFVSSLWSQRPIPAVFQLLLPPFPLPPPLERIRWAQDSTCHTEEGAF